MSANLLQERTTLVCHELSAFSPHGTDNDDPLKRAFDELSSLSIVIAEAGCNRLLGSVR